MIGLISDRDVKSFWKKIYLSFTIDTAMALKVLESNTTCLIRMKIYKFEKTIAYSTFVKVA